MGFFSILKGTRWSEINIVSIVQQFPAFFNRDLHSNILCIYNNEMILQLRDEPVNIHLCI